MNHPIPFTSSTHLDPLNIAAPVLIIEDHVQVRQAIHRMLQKTSHDIRMAADRQTGLAEIRVLPPKSLIISDINLTGEPYQLDGLALAKSTYYHRNSQHQPLIITSSLGIAHEDILTEALQEGIIDYILDKPFGIQELRFAIHRIVLNKLG